jgi:methenyltetrahydrofolate cyclohydrolase
VAGDGRIAGVSDVGEMVGALDRPLGTLLTEIAGEEPAPGGGSAAAFCAAMSAALVASVARLSRERWNGALAAVAQAERLRSRAALLVEMDARAFDQALRTLAERDEIAPHERDTRLEQSLERAAELPLEIAEISADVAELASLASSHCIPEVRADSVSAAILAEAAARTAAGLVEVNLTVNDGDPRLSVVRSLLARAEASRGQALDRRPG